MVSSVTMEGVESVNELLKGSISAFTGNSGVGKSTLINAIFPELILKTGDKCKIRSRQAYNTPRRAL